MRQLAKSMVLGATLVVGVVGYGCGGDSSSTTDSGVTAEAGADAGSDVTVTDCTTASAHIDRAVCAAQAFLATLSTSQLSTANPAFTDAAGRTKWSNLPGVARAGLKMGTLGATSQAAALAMMKVILSTAGMADLDGVRAADDYLNTLGGQGYGSANYYVAVFGTPSATGSWEVMFGGHHMAWNVTYINGVGHPIPNHIGVEPKAAFTVNSTSYQPLADEGDAMLAIFKSLGTTDLASSYLSGQSFSDVLIGPVEYGTGSSAAAKAKFPTGSNRKGVLVSALTTQQQALVTTAIQMWVDDYDPEVASALLSAYTSTAAYADTYVAWGGTQNSGVDPDVSGTYMRLDGPRLWIEVSCQAGVVVQGKTHYHAIYRDKQDDYGATL